MFFIWWTKFGLLAIIVLISIFGLVLNFLVSIFPSSESEVLPEYFNSLVSFISFGLSSIACRIVGKSLNSRITRVVKDKWTGKLTKDFILYMAKRLKIGVGCMEYFVLYHYCIY
tara:strand:+ start:216 stop:557 length:342 start_codon:yes stop_codon:yes gene_type:complete